jgi:spore maturation protein CgeB
MKKEYQAFPPLSVAAYSDYYDVPDKKVWGDYWLKANLISEFKRAGYPVHSSPKILVHLFGEPLREISSETYNIIWIHSHPDWITPDLLFKYKKIYCISRPFTQKILDMGADAEWLMIPTNMPYASGEKQYDIVFVGNTRADRPRKIIRDMGTLPYRIKIWGWGWKGLIPDEWYGGEYYDYERLNELYASSKIVLNDHHDDMRREGFINPRILDVLASGGFVVSDGVRGMEELFGNSVAVYHTPGELREIIEYYLRNDLERETLAGKGRAIASRYNFREAGLKIIGHIESVFDTLCS